MNRATTIRPTRRAVCLAAGALLLVCGATAARCQTPEQFYKARQLTMLVFTGAGSTYDIYARLLVRHLGKHIPGNPTFIVQNMVGAGGFKLVDYLYRIAPADGSVMGTIGRGLPFEPMLGENPVNFDPLRFTWLGSMNRDASLAMAWHTAKVKNFDDLRKNELLVPGTGVGADSEIIPLAINSFAGTRFKIIEGYRDTSVGALAMERGELDGLAYWSWSSIMAAHPDWIRDKKVNLLFHTGRESNIGSPRFASRSAIWSRIRLTKKLSNFCWRGKHLAGRSWRRRWCRLTAPKCCERPSRRRCAIPSFKKTPIRPDWTPIW